MIEYDEQQTRKKKKKKKDSTSTWIVLGVVGGVLVLIVVVLILVVKNMPSGDKDAQAKGEVPEGAQPVIQPRPGPGDAGGRVKPNPNPKGLVQNIRATALRAGRQNEMKNIGQFFVLFVNDFNRNPRTDDEFVQYIQRDDRGAAEAIKEKYYVLNLKANVRGGGGVIAYEELLDAGQHLVVRTDGSVALIPPDELQKLLMQ